MECSVILKAAQHGQVKLRDIVSLIKFIWYLVDSVFRKVEAHAKGF